MSRSIRLSWDDCTGTGELCARVRKMASVLASHHAYADDGPTQHRISTKKLIDCRLYSLPEFSPLFSLFLPLPVIGAGNIAPSRILFYSRYIFTYLAWKLTFPTTIKCYPFRADEEDDISFLVNHKVHHDDPVIIYSCKSNSAQIDRSYDDSTIKLPMKPDILKIVQKQGWIGAEYEHLWRRDGGGSTTLTSHGILNKQNFSLSNLLGGQQYQNRHPKVPRDFAILPFSVLATHIEETLSFVQKLSRELTSTEKRIAEGSINVDDNGDYKLLNRLNNEHIRLQRRSNFEIELGKNLLIYIEEYHKMWYPLWEGGTSYIEDMKEKIDQQMRYSEQLKLDLEVIPRRIKNQSKAVSAHENTHDHGHGDTELPQIFNFITLRDNKLNIQLAESSRRIAEESRRDNLLNLEMAANTASVAEETRQDSAAMKTIAVLTLTFLPGTAVAVSNSCIHVKMKMRLIRIRSTVFLQHEHVYLAGPGGWYHSVATALGVLRDNSPTDIDSFHFLDHLVQVLAEEIQEEPPQSCR
nr:hypothetical protein CFP56_03165 [Quercus suber]